MNTHVSGSLAVLLGILVLWELIWKGLALWRAARGGNTAWYVIMLIINSAGLLPIVYLLTHKESTRH